MSAESTTKSSDADAPAGGVNPPANGNEVRVRTIPEQIVEIVSDSGEGAQTAGQLFGTVCAKMGNGLVDGRDHPGGDRAARRARGRAPAESASVSAPSP